MTFKVIPGFNGSKQPLEAAARSKSGTGHSVPVQEIPIYSIKPTLKLCGIFFATVVTLAAIAGVTLGFADVVSLAVATARTVPGSIYAAVCMIVGGWVVVAALIWIGLIASAGPDPHRLSEDSEKPKDQISPNSKPKDAAVLGMALIKPSFRHLDTS